MIAGYLVDRTRGAGRFTVGGRKFSLAIFTLLSGIFMFLFTTSTTQASVLGYSCANALVLYVPSLRLYVSGLCRVR
jgi:hypothetical protein